PSPNQVPSPRMTATGVPLASPDISSTKPAPQSPRPSPAAEAAFLRTIASRTTLPLHDQPSAGPAHEGVRRLRGAFTIDIDKIRPDPEQPRREWHQEELANLTASVAERG